jgi:hypothetical protein
MEVLKVAILTLVQNVHAQKIEQLVSGIRAAEDLDDPFRDWATSERSRRLVADLQSRLSSIEMSNSELASLIEGID